MAKRVALTSLLPSTSAALGPEVPTRPVESDAAPTAGGAAPVALDCGTTADPMPAPASQLETKRSIGSRLRDPGRSSDAGHRHYSQLTRKEARLREDQIDDLAAEARRLSRAKINANERITDNTLIRIAVDLLLADASRLQGSTEAELRDSMGL